MHGTSGARLVAVRAPILASQRGYIEGGAGQFGEIRDGTRGIAIVKVLQDVVADHEIAGGARCEIHHRALGPLVSVTKIVACLETLITGSRQGRGESLAQ